MKIYRNFSLYVSVQLFFNTLTRYYFYSRCGKVDKQHHIRITWPVFYCVLSVRLSTSSCYYCLKCMPPFCLGKDDDVRVLLFVLVSEIVLTLRYIGACRPLVIDGRSRLFFVSAARVFVFNKCKKKINSH